MDSDKNYKSVCSIESLSSPRIGINVHILLDRELTREEQSTLNRFVREFSNTMHLNTLLQDPIHIHYVKTMKGEILNCFPSIIYVKEIPNEYSSEAGYPWYLVTTSKGQIKIGWRSSVINIDWLESDITKNADDLFPNEKVTKIGHSIHAWGYEKANQYLLTILGS